MHPALVAAFQRMVAGAARPRLTEVGRHLTRLAARRGIRPPSRASLYNALPMLPGTSYAVEGLPAPVRDALYNLDGAGPVPGRQVAFYSFNYGSLAAMSFAAGLPWLDLYQAGRLRGWRPRSRGVLLAALRARGRR
jgi:hypothetical protein